MINIQVKKKKLSFCTIDSEREKLSFFYQWSDTENKWWGGGSNCQRK